MMVIMNIALVKKKETETKWGVDDHPHSYLVDFN